MPLAEHRRVLRENRRLAEELARAQQGLDAQARERTHQVVQSEKLQLASRMAAAVAHEINNPVSVVMANLRVLKEYACGIEALWEAAREAVATLDRAGETDMATRLLNAGAMGGLSTEDLVQDVQAVVDETLNGTRRIVELMDGFGRLAKVDSSSPCERRPVDLCEMARSVVRDVARAPGAREMPLTLCPERPRGLADPAELRRALTAILDYLQSDGAAPTGTPIDVRVLTCEEQPCIEIHDPAFQREGDERSIFDPQIRVDHRAGPMMRLDLDLPVAYLLLKRNSGDLTFERSPSGATFRVVLATG